MQYDLTDERDREALIWLVKHAGRMFPAGVIAEIRPARRKGDEQKEEECSTSTASS